MKYFRGKLLLLGSGMVATSITIANCQASAKEIGSTPLITYQIPSQSLTSALNSFAEQAKVQILFDPGLMRTKHSPALSGRYQVADALSRLLEGSGLVASRADNDTFTISVDAQSAVSLPNSADETSQSDASTTAGVEDIVVTAQGRVQLLQDVPVAVSVASGEALANANLLNLQDVTARMPGVNISPTPLAEFVSIRGVGSSLNVGFEQSVGTFVDGIYRGRARSTRAALFDIERVEILRGPQTTFFGNNTIAGALNITTRKPRNEFELNGTAFYAPNMGEYMVEAGVTVPLSNDLSVRVAGRQSGMDGYIKNTTTGKDGPDKNDKVGRIALRWDSSSGIVMDARLDGGRMRDTGITNTEYLGCPPDPSLGPAAGPCARYLAANGGVVDDDLDRVSANNPSFFNYDFVEGEWRTAIDMGRNSLTLTSGYFWHDSHLFTDVLPVPARQGGSVVGTDYTFIVDTDERYRQFSQEIRFASPADGLLSYMVGAYYAHSRLNVNFYHGLYFVPFGRFSGGEYTATTPVAGHIVNTEKADTLSSFAAVTLRPVDRLRVNLGLRYSSVKKKATRFVEAGTSGTARPTDANFVPGNATTQANLLPALSYDIGQFARPVRTDNKLMPAVSIQYDLTPDVMGYVSYAKGFKAGGYSVLVSKSDFGPENVNDFEIGFKSSLFDRMLTLNIDAFYSKYKDLQESTTIQLANGSSFQVVTNVAASVAKGVEMGATLRPVPGLTLTADVAYLNSIYRSYPGAPCTALQTAQARANGIAACVQDMSGKRRAFAPEWSGNIGAEYVTDIGSDFRLNLQGDIYFTSFFYQQPIADRLLSQDSFAKINARIGFGARNGRWEVAVIGRNLTNKLTASFRAFSAASASYQALADTPRSVGIQLKLRN